MRRHELTEKDLPTCLPTYRVSFSKNLKIFQKSQHFPKIFVEKSYKHSETGMTLLICPWPVKIAGYDLNLGPEISSRIPLQTLRNCKDITDAPLACGDNRPQGSAGWLAPVPLKIIYNGGNLILVQISCIFSCPEQLNR